MSVYLSCSLYISVYVLQALLSSHDSVAQSDYEPVLPPLPEELPGDEDAMRIVCLVKNDQPLVRLANLQLAKPSVSLQLA